MHQAPAHDNEVPTPVSRDILCLNCGSGCKECSTNKQTAALADAARDRTQAYLRRTEIERDKALADRVALKASAAREPANSASTSRPVSPVRTLPYHAARMPSGDGRPERSKVVRATGSNQTFMSSTAPRPVAEVVALKHELLAVQLKCDDMIRVAERESEKHKSNALALEKELSRQSRSMMLLQSKLDSVRLVCNHEKKVAKDESAMSKSKALELERELSQQQKEHESNSFTYERRVMALESDQEALEVQLTEATSLIKSKKEGMQNLEAHLHRLFSKLPSTSDKTTGKLKKKVKALQAELTQTRLKLERRTARLQIELLKVHRKLTKALEKEPKGTLMAAIQSPLAIMLFRMAGPYMADQLQRRAARQASAFYLHIIQSTGRRCGLV